MRVISSASNDEYIKLKSLATSKGQNKHGEFLLMGDKLVREFLANGGDFRLLAEVRTPELTAVSSAPQLGLAPALFNEIDVVGTHSNLLLLEKPELPFRDLTAKPQGLELICPIGDPINLGAVLRSALAFGVRRVLLTTEAANPFHPRCIKASAGAVLRLEIFKTSALTEIAAKIPAIAGFTAALDLNGVALPDVRWPRDQRLLVGEEGPGLPALPGLPRISIPTQDVESLNVAVATSVALYAYQTSQKKS